MSFFAADNAARLSAARKVFLPSPQLIVRGKHLHMKKLMLLAMALGLSLSSFAQDKMDDKKMDDKKMTDSKSKKKKKTDKMDKMDNKKTTDKM
jgi:hypothetical protein